MLPFHAVPLVIANLVGALIALRPIIVTIPTIAGVEVEALPTIVTVPSTISITIAPAAAMNVIAEVEVEEEVVVMELIPLTFFPASAVEAPPVQHRMLAAIVRYHATTNQR
jgi:hypothetical protein